MGVVQRHEVEPVVGVKVADHDVGERARIVRPKLGAIPEPQSRSTRTCSVSTR